MSYQEQQELESTYVMATFARKPVEFVRGEGMRLFDSEGKAYLDFLSGIGVVSLGHCDVVVTQAIAEQAQKLMQVSNFFYVEQRGELARDISELLNTSSSAKEPWKSFFSNSGAEANEGAIKLARKYGKLYKGGAGTVLTANRSFHGRTLITTAATAQEAKQESFAPMPPGFAHFEPDTIQSLIDCLDACEQSAKEQGRAELAPVAVLLECIQGEGGVRVLPDEYIRAVRELTQKRGLLLMIDEIQSGLYRSGKPFSFMHAGIKPDVVTMAKGIANGFPCGVTAATGTAGDIFVPGEHGSTFGGGPVAMAAARATLTELASRKSGANAHTMGGYFMDKLGALPHIVEVRGKGLMIGASLDTPLAAQIADECLERGIVINAIGTHILRFLPPLCVKEPEIDELILVLRELLEQL